jgi:serine/threonine protein kinase
MRSRSVVRWQIEARAIDQLHSVRTGQTALPREPANRALAALQALISGGATEQNNDLRALLYDRMHSVLGLCLLLLLVMNARIWLIANLAQRLTQTDRVVSILMTGTALLGGLWLRRNPNLSIDKLRRLEALVLFLLVLAMSYLTSSYLTRVVVLPSVPPIELTAQIHDRFWALYPDSSVHVQTGFQSLVGFLSNRWCAAVVLYGVLIPNTVRRCGVAMLLIICAFVSSVLLAAWHTPALTRIIGATLALAIPQLALFAAIGLFGCHKLGSLRDQVLAAKQIGQYELEERIGEGGMGEVYLARHRLLRRPCALKVMRPDHIHDRELIARFEREVQAMARLTHPNTVEIYDYGRTKDGIFYYVMEYLSGTTADSLVRRHGPLSGGRTIYLLKQACRALREAHGQGLIHRDVKPGNMYVCERGGEFDRLKLFDFGLVQMTERDETKAKHQSAAGHSPNHPVKLTEIGNIMGTPMYMAPEQVRGEEVDARTDIYSLGVVAYFLLTGETPFRYDTAVDVCFAHLYEAPLPPSQKLASVPADLEAVVLRCLRKERSERYETVEDLYEALSLCACQKEWGGARARQWWQKQRGEPSPESTGSPVPIVEDAPLRRGDGPKSSHEITAEFSPPPPSKPE